MRKPAVTSHSAKIEPKNGRAISCPDSCSRLSRMLITASKIGDRKAKSNPSNPSNPTSQSGDSFAGVYTFPGREKIFHGQGDRMHPFLHPVTPVTSVTPTCGK